MERVALLTVESTSWLNRNTVRMLIIRPAFAVPKGWKERGWTQRTEMVSVVTPDGREIEATAQINMTHLSFRGSLVPAGAGWRITIWLIDRTPEEPPNGSKILVSQEVRDAILPHNVA